jgi:hypothetical protein
VPAPAPASIRSTMLFTAAFLAVASKVGMG